MQQVVLSATGSPSHELQNKDLNGAPLCMPFSTSLTAGSLVWSPSLVRRSVRHVLRRCKPGTTSSMAGHQDDSQTLHALDIPPTVSLGARVEHILVEKPGLLSHTIAKALSLPEDFVRELIRFGAVHWSPVLPDSPAAAADALQAQRALEARGAAIAALGTRPELSQPRRAAEDIHVTQHAYVRVHVHPKRFPAAYSVDWKERIVHAAEDYVVVNKPAGVPVVPPVDNILESCLACSAQALGESAPLLSVHRLDACTEGLVVLGRSRAFVAAFNRASQQPGRVRKHYRTLTLARPPLGVLVHHARTGVRRRGLPPHTEVLPEAGPEGAVRCELEVLEARRVRVGPAASALGWPEAAWEALLVLRTGRTHQIRAQFAAVGAPLLGDTLYGPLARGQPPPPEAVSRNDLLPQGADRVLSEPLSAGIGLQACRLTILDGAELMGGQACFEAPPPWWHDGA